MPSGSLKPRKGKAETLTPCVPGKRSLREPLTLSAPLVTAASKSSCAIRALSEEPVRTTRVTSAAGSGAWRRVLVLFFLSFSSGGDKSDDGDEIDDNTASFLLGTEATLATGVAASPSPPLWETPKIETSPAVPTPSTEATTARTRREALAASKGDTAEPESLRTAFRTGLVAGVGSGVAVALEVGFGVAVGVAVAVGAGVETGVASGAGVAVAVAVGVGAGVSVAAAVVAGGAVVSAAAFTTGFAVGEGVSGGGGGGGGGVAAGGGGDAAATVSAGGGGGVAAGGGGEAASTVSAGGVGAAGAAGVEVVGASVAEEEGGEGGAVTNSCASACFL